MNILTSRNTGLLSAGMLFVRLMTGLILFVAGAGKAFGWFGGIGMDTTVSMFHSELHWDAWLAYLSTYAELICGPLLMIGLLTRPAALALTINMVVATITVGTKNFFMGGGAYPCLIAVNCLLILLAGPMQYSIDHLLTKEGRNVNRP